MLQSLSRGAQLLRRASVSSAIFGVGYGVCWAQGREESVDKLLVWGAARSLVGFKRSLRLLGQVLPDGAEWPREQLRKVERDELSSLCLLVERCREQGLDSPILQQLLLESLCEHAQVDAHGLAVQGLCFAGAEAEGEATPPASSQRSALTELAVRLDGAVIGSDSGTVPAPARLLPQLSAALVSTMEAGSALERDSWQKDLGAEGLLSLSRAATVASSWLAASSARQSLPRQCNQACSSEALSAEEAETVSDGLCKVLQVLGRPQVLAEMRSGKGRSKEANEVRRDLRARLSELEVLWPAQSGLIPTKDFLPSKLKARLLATRATLSSGAGLTFSDNSREGSGILGKAEALFTWLARAALLWVALAAASEDGLGLLRFYVVPEALRPMLKQRALRVEELLLRHDAPQAPEEHLVDTLGPIQAHPEFIQAPLFTGPTAG
eukprot:TRINITY_DN28642_c0_g2_i1.p1 TRINITY_DN28642_c0_g2~~TRINITY_DN28642_c0_g2_i1.p1  ORF type:complete len:439 (-),score=100.71 TRINITY_DN28642_c0_g2_i1:38-1354(-)